MTGWFPAATELCGPVDLLALWYGRAIAQRTAPPLLRAAPMVLFAMVLLPLMIPEWRLAGPASPGAGLAFAATVVGAIALSAAITTLVHISLMWTLGGDGIVTMNSALVHFLSGMIIPLPLMPVAVQTVIA